MKINRAILFLATTLLLLNSCAHAETDLPDVHSPTPKSSLEIGGPASTLTPIASPPVHTPSITHGLPEPTGIISVDWMRECMQDAGVNQEELQNREISNLNEMAMLLDYNGCFWETSALTSLEITYSLEIYCEFSTKYDYELEQTIVSDGLLYPPDGYISYSQQGYWEYWPNDLEFPSNDFDFLIDRSSCVYYSEEKADDFLEDIIGITVSGNERFTVNDAPIQVFWEGTVCYAEMSDPCVLEYSLERYQQLADDLLYLSFSADDKWFSGDSDYLVGIQSDYCRLLVKRSDSKWGFTVVAKLKDGEDSLLPEDFPLPKVMVD